MKTITRLFPALVAIVLILSSCATSSITMDVLEPAEINVPLSIRKIGIVNRSLPSKDNKWNNILEGLASGESIKIDKVGSEECIKAMAEKLNQSPRFSAVTIYGLGLPGTGTGRFPLPLDHAQVKQICQQYDVDALVMLETFDSDISLRQGDRMVERKIDDQKVRVREFFADAEIDVNSGWRIYDGSEMVIIDENIYTDEKSYSGVGDTPDKALGNLPDKKSAINEAAVNSGRNYARRISPTWRAVTRQYYVKGHPEMEAAAKSVKKGKWDPAIEVWKRLAREQDPELAGRAAYNMAVGCEVKGELDLALVWANKSFKEFGNKKASSYIGVLNARKYEQQRLNQQMQ